MYQQKDPAFKAHLTKYGPPQGKGLNIASVQLVGSDSKVEWHQTADALEATLPDTAPGKYAYVLRIALK